MRQPNTNTKNFRKDREKEFEEQLVEVARVSRTMAGGRRISFRATMVIGDRKGRVGIGMGKSKEVMEAASKAVKKAKKDLVVVPIVNKTIPHEIIVDFKGAKIFMKPAVPGTGIIAGGVIRTVANLAGIENILSKSLGSSNKLNSLKATIKALKILADEHKYSQKQQIKPKKKEDNETVAKTKNEK
ncbi:30S ribosomal protein S5 [Patescibacteria group bacterium]